MPTVTFGISSSSPRFRGFPTWHVCVSNGLAKLESALMKREGDLSGRKSICLRSGRTVVDLIYLKINMDDAKRSRMCLHHWRCVINAPEA